MSVAFWAPLAAVVALLAVVWIASQSDDGPAPSLVATGVENTHSARADVRLPKSTAKAKAVANIHAHRDPSPGSSIRENSGVEQPAIPETELAPQAAVEHPAATGAPQQPVATITPTTPPAPPYRSEYTPPKATGKSTPLPKDAFVVSLARDNAGCIWIGTEDLGVFRFDPSASAASQWTEFTTSDGLGDDNAYALCVDRLGRVWVGHLNHGVSVYNGQSWVDYDVPDGPIGERVFSIAADPKSGDVWIATSAGLTRYSLEKDTWTHYTRDDGLPSDQVQSLAFDGRGTLYAGTQCDGLAISDPPRTAPVSREALAAGRAAPEPPTRRWRQVVGPDTVPLAPSGPGLPSNLINDVLVSRSGTVFVATTCGLAASNDHGKSWSFIRGADWGAKVKGLYGGPPRGWREGPAPLLLTEDYCTCLAEDDSGLLWIGHRQTGYEAIDPRSLQRRFDSRGDKKAKGTEKASPDYVTAMLSMHGYDPLVGWYGNGLTPEVAAGHPLPESRAAASASVAVRHPTPAARPTLDELNALLAKLGTVQTLRQLTPTVVAIPDDWRTQGDWLGRYGRYWACLAAICSPDDYIWGTGPGEILYSAQIGPNHPEADDSLRYWIHWLYTDNRCSLEIPPTYFDSQVVQGIASPKANRRQAEWDDHGEAYSQAIDGPDVYCTLKIPAGQFYLSLYDFNKDGHAGNNRFRDYRVSIRPHARGLRLDTLSDFSRQTELAAGRIHDFWGGVWKRYYVQGPIALTIQVRRNGSFNTLLAGVMLDLVDEQPMPYFRTGEQWQSDMERLSSARNAILSEPVAARSEQFSPRSDLVSAADSLSEELENARLRNALWWSAEGRPCYAALARLYRSGGASDFKNSGSRRAMESPDLHAHSATCYYQLRLFDRWEREQRAESLVPARDIERALRWDEVSDIDQGRGYQIVTKFLASRQRPDIP